MYYTTLREAVNATQNYENDYKDTVTLIKDIQLENTLEISEEKALILDLNGYTLTILPGQKGIINNHGNLNIANNNIEKNGNIKIETMDAYYGVYNLYGNLKITGGIIDCINNGNQSNYGIYNESGNVEIIEGSVRSSNSGNYFENYGIYNSNGTVKAIGGIINSSSNGNYSKSYGIYNNMGNVTIEDEGTIISSNSGDYGDCCGIYNNNGVIKVLEGSVSSNGSNFNMNSNGIYNASTGSIEVQGGIISSIGTDTNIYSNGIYNASTGSIIITGGTINTLGISYSNGIYNASTGNVKIIQGEIISNTDNGYGNGIYNFGEGNIEVIGGTINCNGYNNSYAIFNLGEKNIIIGSKENELNRESPIIKVNTYYSGYGCGIFTKSGVEFYNGSIQGDVAILGGIENIRDGYKIENIIENQKELIYLVEKIDNDYIAQIDEIQYMSLQKAIDSLNPNEEKTIKIIKDFELEENIIFNKNIILDLNGHIITNNYYRIENVQTLKVTDTSGGKLESINTIFGILNGKNGSIEMLGGTINSISRFYGGVSYGIYNSEGTVTIIDGTVSSKGSSSSNSYGIYNDNGNVELLGGNVKSEGTSSSSYGIGNSKGTIKVENGIINSSSTRYSYGIYNSNGTIIIEGGEITSSSSSSNSYGISNSNGILTISDGIIISKCENKYDGTSRGIDNSNGIVKITGGTIMSNTNTRNISYSCGIYNSKGTIEIIKGTIISGATNSNSYGIYNNKGDIIIGTKGDGVVSQEEPYIKSEYTGTSNSYNGYGIYNITEKLYFYDGKIEGSTKVVYDTITEYEDNTQLNYNEDETILTLSTILTPVAQIGNTTYNTLEEAISVVGSSQTTIKLLRNVSYTTNSTVIMIPENKNIVLDLNGYKISSSIPERTIENNGTLEITDTSVTQTGTIVTSEEKTVSNMLGAKLTISGGIIENRNKCSIYNEGNIELVSGNLTVKSSEEAYGIYNANSGSAILAGGIISCNNSDNIIEGSSKSYGIYNEGIGNVKVIGGTINSKNGSSYGIYNKNSGNIEMSSGTINSDSYNYSYGIYNESTGSIEIIGGTVNCISYYSSNYGIYNKDNGSITIGFKEDEKISQEEPEIRGEYTGKYSSEYGYGISNLNGNLYFYDGKISGSTKGIVGNISELEEKTELQIIEETIDNRVNEVIILQPKPSNVARVNGVEYDSIEKAVKACGTNTSTITILRDSDPGATLIIENNQNITIDLNGYTINNYIEMQNKGTLKITDSSSGQTGKIVGLVGIAVSNSGTMELQSGAIADSGYGIKNTGTLTINNNFK